MSLLVPILAFVCALVLATCLWVGLHLHYTRRLDAAKSRHDRLKRESDEALGAAQDKLAAVRQQLLDAQLELKRTLRLVPAAAVASGRAKPSESLLALLDAEDHSEPANEGEFEKTLRLAGAGR